MTKGRGLSATSGQKKRPAPKRLFNMVASAIGIYMMRSTKPVVTKYRGKRGSWEDDQPVTS